MHMNKDKYLSKLTKPELIKTGILAVIMALVFIYSLYKTGAVGHGLTGLIICVLLSFVFLPLPIYIGIKMGLANREQIKASLQQKLIYTFGILAMLFGSFLNTNAIFQIAWLLAGFGLIRVKKWGLYTFITIAAVYSLLVVVDLLSGSTLQLLKQILSNRAMSPDFAIGAVILVRALTLVFCLSGIYCLTRHKVKEQFK